MSEVSIITNDEIMEMTQLVFDRYYTELKRQLRRGEIPAEKAEEYCTEILFKVYQALQTQSVAATSYEIDACAIPIINEEIRKILVPLHLSGYRNLRENPVTESQSETEAALDDEQVVENVGADEKEENTSENRDAVQGKAAVPVVSNGEVQVYPETAENELNPELRMEIRRILQQEFQLEPAQVKPVVVVVNVTAPQPVAQAEGHETTETVRTETKEQMPEETVRAEAKEPIPEETVRTEARERISEQPTEAKAQVPEETVRATAEEQVPVEIIGTETVQPVETEAAVTIEEEKVPLRTNAETQWDSVEIVEIAQEQKAENQHAEDQHADQEPLPELDFDIEKLIQESEATEEAAEKKESNHLWLWAPIIMLLLVLLWLTIGMLMSYDIIPEFNLGYEWFNESLFELF